jgi:hypothetical protein
MESLRRMTDTHVHNVNKCLIIKTFLFTAPVSRTALGPTQPRIQWVPRALSLGVKWLGRGAEHLPPSSAEVKYTCSHTSTSQYVFMAWCLVKHRDFTLPQIK